MTTLLVPGFMADADLWADVVPSLQARAPVRHADLTQDDSIASMARRALDAAPPSFDLVGFSMGGYVAREMARLAPVRVRSLVLIATSARSDTPQQARRKLAAVTQLASSGQQFRGLSRASIVSSLQPGRSTDARLIERIRAMGARLGRDTFLRQATINRQSDLDRLAAIRCPTLVVFGEHDRLRSPEEAKELQSGIAGAVLRVIEDSGHMVPMEAPQSLMDLVLPWLASTGHCRP
jgi:pimeloyl-ACP methyl ester carboxylesterase